MCKFPVFLVGGMQSYDICPQFFHVYIENFMITLKIIDLYPVYFKDRIWNIGKKDAFIHILYMICIKIFTPANFFVLYALTDTCLSLLKNNCKSQRRTPYCKHPLHCELNVGTISWVEFVSQHSLVKLTLSLTFAKNRRGKKVKLCNIKHKSKSWTCLRFNHVFDSYYRDLLNFVSFQCPHCSTNLSLTFW